MERSLFHIPICLIRVWSISGFEAMNEEPQNPLMLTECASIEIDESYKKLFSTAKVSFPRGTVIKRTITQEMLEASDGKNGTNPQFKVDAVVEDSGVLVTTRAYSEKASVTHFKVGQRIQIYLGYTKDPKIAAFANYSREYMTPDESKYTSIYNDPDKLRRYKNAMTLMFDGFITKCSIDTPIEIQCEDLASYLKKITCPKIPGNKNWTVNDLLAPDGKWKLLAKSGLKLHPETMACDINVGALSISDDLTVADVLTEWAKRVKLYSYVRTDPNGVPALRVGRSYTSAIKGNKDSYKDTVLRQNEQAEIDFSYNVAENGLTMMSTDKAFLAVDAQSMENIGTGKSRNYHITVRKNPEYVEGKSNPNTKYQILNETTISAKARKAGATVLGKSKDKVDLSSYTIVPYISKKINISHEDLQVEAIKFFESYNTNGIDGTLTLFGDLALKSGTKVHLNDKLFPAKNGWYMIDEVVTKFGPNGYRQVIKLPYCISRDKETVEEK